MLGSSPVYSRMSFAGLMSQQNADSHKVADVHGGVVMRGCYILLRTVRMAIPVITIYCLLLHGRGVWHTQQSGEEISPQS